MSVSVSLGHGGLALRLRHQQVDQKSMQLTSWGSICFIHEFLFSSFQRITNGKLTVVRMSFPTNSKVTLL